MSVFALTSLEEVKQAQSGGRCMFFFWASWHEPSTHGGQMHGVFNALATKYPSVKFFSVEAEAFPEISEYFEVAVVPTFYATNNKAMIGKVEGANPSELSKLAKLLMDNTSSQSNNISASPVIPKVDINVRLKELINTAPVMLFMKGSPSEPRCGFSRKIVDLLNENNIEFASFDILSDQEVRESLKTYSDWPTYPQLYVKEELLGGLDIVKEMAEGGDLKGQMGL